MMNVHLASFLCLVAGLTCKTYDEIVDNEIPVGRKTKTILQVAQILLFVLLTRHTETFIFMSTFAMSMVIMDKLTLSSNETKNLDDPFFILFDVIVVITFVSSCMFAASRIWRAVTPFTVSMILFMYFVAALEAKFFNEEISNAKVWCRIGIAVFMVCLILCTHMFLGIFYPVVPVAHFAIGYIIAWMTCKFKFAEHAIAPSFTSFETILLAVMECCYRLLPLWITDILADMLLQKLLKLEDMGAIVKGLVNIGDLRAGLLRLRQQQEAAAHIQGKSIRV
jgi:hypothetical protein